MTTVLNWMRAHKFEAHTLAFALMVLPPAPLYLAAQHGANGWIWPLLGLVILGNLLELAIR